MLAETLISAGAFLAGGGATWLANYVKSSFGDPVVGRDIGNNVVHKSEKHDSRDMSTYDIIKRGYDAMGAMAKDIHDLYHPPDCKCAICQIRADDDDSDPNAYTGDYCSLPCFNCSVITCPTHPDRRPAAKAKEKITYKPKAMQPGARGGPIAGVRTDDQGKKWVLISEHEDGNRKDIAIQNLETQLKDLTEKYQQVVAQRDSLMNERGLRSAGMHVGGKPLYMVDEMARPASGPGSRLPFEPDPKATDRQNMQRLAQICQDEDLVPNANDIIAKRIAREERVRELEHHEKLHPGYMIEEFGEGPVRYICEQPGGCDMSKGRKQWWTV